MVYHCLFRIPNSQNKSMSLRGRLKKKKTVTCRVGRWRQAWVIVPMGSTHAPIMRALCVRLRYEEPCDFLFVYICLMFLPQKKMSNVNENIHDFCFVLIIAPLLFLAKYHSFVDTKIIFSFVDKRGVIVI